MKYRAEIDGLRALAIVPVVLFHAGYGLFSGGFVGVDVFFVISGYLISTILLEEHANQTFSLVNFYERRIRRIIPALFLVMLVCLPFAWAWMLPKQMVSFSNSLMGTALSVSNMVFWKESGYFAAAAEEKPLLHTWSLAVEEQYYLVFPLLLGLLWKFGSRKLFLCLVAIAICSLALSEWGWRHQPTANFFFALTRAWELILGALAAFFIRQRGLESNNLLSILALALVLFSIFGYDEQIPFPSLYSLVPVLGSLGIILFADSGTLVGRLLSLKPLVWIGLISYSTYLWHQPLLAYSRLRTTEDAGTAEIAVLILGSFILGYLGYRFVERPFRDKQRFSRRFVFNFFIVGTLLFVVLGATGKFTGGLAQRFDKPGFVQAGKFTLPSREQGFCFYNFNTHKGLEVGVQGTQCTIGSDNPESPSLLLYGDSFAAQWEPYFENLSQSLDFQLSSVTTNWCFPSLGEGSTAPAGHISRRQCLMNRQWFEKHYRDYDVIVLAAAWYQVYEHQLSGEFVDLLETVAADKDITVMVLDVPVLLRRDSVERAVYFPDQKVIEDPLKAEPAAAFWQQVTHTVPSAPNLIFVTQQQLGFEKDGTHKTREGYPYSLDGSHISVYGSESLFEECPDLAQQVEKVLVRFDNSPEQTPMP
ncbi:acyltransferase family protein [Oceanobacter mangrovi]|uniref:acyltransferase family protein n=1 Tax=Oceanobacter mangrovi TaxID=2862510 RepID=UPI001C8F023A|nr:acyltransferase family protein [Oceanobacter mangrovi]